MNLRVLKLLYQCALGKVLYAHVNRCHDVASVCRRSDGNVKPLVEHLAALGDAACAAEDGVVGEFESATCRVFGSEHVANRTLG